jgi:Cu-Zn family superoxide dismutase
MNRVTLSLFAVLVCGVAIGCDSMKSGNTKKMQADQMGKTAVAEIKPASGAATQPANKNVTGTVTFTQAGDDLAVAAHLMGLSPGKHGIHIHNHGDLSDPHLISAGSHYDTDKHKHGGPETAEHHSGDLGNITADDAGNAHLEIMLKNMKLDSLVGKSVIVHANEDDLKSDPAGNSGGRIAGGVINAK